MALQLGLTPDDLTVTLARDADFIASLVSIDQNTGVEVDYLAGTEIYLILNGTERWDATVAGNSADWNIDKALVNALINSGGQRNAVLYYVNGTTEQMWAKGFFEVA
jgi:hypothetical protein